MRDRRKNWLYKRILLAGMAAFMACQTVTTAWAIGPGETGNTSSSSGSGPTSPGNTGTNTGSSQNAQQANPDSWKKKNGSYWMPDGTAISNVYARGIDVSRWQGEIDWQQVASDDISFVMLGTRSKGAVDPFFHKNIQAAAQAGVKVGAYIYSLATTPEMAQQEADFVIDLIKDYPVSYPIALDMEDEVQRGLSREQLAQIANAFCDRISAAGYYPIIYANDNWLAEVLDMSQMQYPVWAANYSTRPRYSSPVMWQATSSGSVKGINGRVDIDFQFTDFSGVIPANIWRNIGGNDYYYQNYAIQKDAWIHDGDGWYYMGGDGLARKGWFSESGATYYLDEGTGKMHQGWKSQDDKWYYLGSSGALQTGWIQDNGEWYHADQEGVMETGFRQIDGNWYYLRGSGARAVGWRQVEGSWRYFDSEGRMANGWQQDGGAWYYMDNEGRMTTGWQKVGGTWYYLNGDGSMRTGLLELGGASYYLDGQGALAVSREVTVNGTSYIADENGVLSLPQLPEENSSEGGQQAADSGQGSTTDPAGTKAGPAGSGQGTETGQVGRGPGE